MGGRSANVQQFLQANGFTRVKNLIGGLQAWKRDVDPGISVA
jgi:rhodanese-related sulfurtransferase